MNKLSGYMNNLQVVAIRYVPGTGGDHNDGRFDLITESMECPYFLGGSVSIPEDPMIYGEIDIPSYDGRDMEQWILDTKKNWIDSQK